MGNNRLSFVFFFQQMIMVNYLPLCYSLVIPFSNQGFRQVAAFLIDLFMMIIIVVHCFRIRSTQGRLGRLFLFQGFVVFVLMSTLNIGIAWNYLSTSREFNGVFVPISLTLSNVLACRLTLSLRRQATPSESYQLRMQSEVVGRALRRHEAWAQTQIETHGRDHSLTNTRTGHGHRSRHSRAWSSLSLPLSLGVSV
ncbi:hypothetical protein L218DRAFT_681321 [Marasmius fiardii PR-910]|nr:hypothetical protein L218DRAFT_681321 [Marasmius fiardii PR-910]